MLLRNDEMTVRKRLDVPRSKDRSVKGESDLLGPGFPVPVLKTVDYQDKHTLTQRRHEVKTDKQRGEEDGNYTTIDFHLCATMLTFPVGEKLEEILKWLDGLNCAEKQDITSSLRQEDTCKWLFDTTQYKTWKDGTSGSLWLRGKRETF